MKVRKLFKVKIPFPAWDGVFHVYRVCDELRRNEMLKGISVHRTPRSISMGPAPAIEGFDDTVSVQYWYSNGCKAVAMLAGRNDQAYGTTWALKGLTVEWQDRALGLPVGEDRLALQLDTDQVEALNLTTYLRRHLGDYEGRETFDEAKADLAENELISDAIADKLAAPFRAVYERQKICRATLAACNEGREFSWMPGCAARPLPAPPLCIPKWKEDSDV
jgi:hypothetical protein